jgi:Uri superfamily endonuclease
LTKGVNSSRFGSYVLALWLDAPHIIPIGKMGTFEFTAGWYLYAGSARAPGGLAARLARHRQRLGPHKRAKWHVDFLREWAAWGGAWGRTSDERLECAWAAACRSLPGAAIVVPGFGASDCRCPAHLVHVPTLPGDDWFAEFMDARRLYVADEELDDLLQTLTTGSEESREAAALALGRFGAAAVEPLAAMLARSDADIRWWAARALAEVDGCGAVPALEGALADSDPDVRACAALALGRIGEGAAAPALAARLADESAFVASIAADALSMIGEPAVEALAGMLTHDSPHVRLLSVRALGRIKSEHAIVPLFGLLEDSSYLVRYYTQETLEALGVGMVFFGP